MKRLLPLFVVALTLSMIIAPFALAADAAKPTPTVPDRSPGAPIAGAISTVTGMAISPLLGTGAYGAYQYFNATTPEQKAALPWFAHWAFFGPALLIVGACAVKDALGASMPPGLKKPFDVLETIENKATGLVAAGAVVPSAGTVVPSAGATVDAGVAGALRITLPVIFRPIASSM